MGDFKVSFGVDINYNDPEYRFLQVTAAGEAAVSCAERAGTEDDITTVKMMIETALIETASQLSVDGVSYKDLTAQQPRFTEAVSSALSSKTITLSSFVLNTLALTPRSQEQINRINKMKEMAAMSPEELQKKMMEAQAAAQAYMDSLSPEERQRMEEKAKRDAEEAAAKMKATMEMAQRISAGESVDSVLASQKAARTDSSGSGVVRVDGAGVASAGVAGAGVAAAGVAGAGVAAAGAPVPAAPRFCPNCGAPNKGGKFCTGCGKAF
ncbi:hypothetical protein SAMN02910456_02308 [Ruminococcaceae bacterium YRB3002]|nr:hypothetical protein SAMN02910456_02308 [Ruminococcaceae bacterium YRB3002]